MVWVDDDDSSMGLLSARLCMGGSGPFGHAQVVCIFSAIIGVSCEIFGRREEEDRETEVSTISLFVSLNMEFFRRK